MLFPACFPPRNASGKKRILILIALACFFLSVMIILPLRANLAVFSEEGRYFDVDDNPTYNISEDGTVDWLTYNGFRRYHSECHVCHGPDGLGSSFAPSLVDSLKKISYFEYLEIVTNGRENIGVSSQNKMPAFGENRNVMCYVDDIYVYLKARSDDSLNRGRPRKKERKSAQIRTDEDDCIGG